jgi:predicted metal-binding protein
VHLLLLRQRFRCWALLRGAALVSRGCAARTRKPLTIVHAYFNTSFSSPDLSGLASEMLVRCKTCSIKVHSQEAYDGQIVARNLESRLSSPCVKEQRINNPCVRSPVCCKKQKVSCVLLYSVLGNCTYRLFNLLPGRCAPLPTSVVGSSKDLEKSFRSLGRIIPVVRGKWVEAAATLGMTFTALVMLVVNLIARLGTLELELM